jgi:hypothetical protein
MSISKRKREMGQRFYLKTVNNGRLSYCKRFIYKPFRLLFGSGTVGAVIAVVTFIKRQKAK